jgi:Skp family chaperone for outer membrane proteins
MKVVRFIVTAVLLILVTSVMVFAQQPGASRPAATPAPAAGAASVPDGKVAIVDTEAFGNPKTGIVRLVRAFESVNNEFKIQRDELQKLRAQYDQIVKDVNATKSVADQKALAAKADQAESLKKQIERKSQDAQEAYSKRLRDVTGPVWKDINIALAGYARQRGASVVFDASKLSEVMLVINGGIDITQGFIADYNQRNPAAAAASPTRPAASPTKP